MLCPRRDELGSDLSMFKLADKEDEWQDRGHGHQQCSWCGSMHPDKFMELVETGNEVVPTDKNYKAYIMAPGQEKFYFPHLSKEQMMRLVELYNSEKIKLGYPGYFYVRPYFMVLKTKDVVKQQ